MSKAFIYLKRKGTKTWKRFNKRGLDFSEASKKVKEWSDKKPDDIFIKNGIKYCTVKAGHSHLCIPLKKHISNFEFQIRSKGRRYK